MATLHITNGDSAGTTLSRSGIGGEVLPWRDVLHDGPVPQADPDTLARIRAEFLSEAFEQALPETLQWFHDRNRAVANLKPDDEVVLWFEHDLYDQLQLIQLLPALAAPVEHGTQARIVCIDRHPEIPDFRGLGQLNEQQLAALLPSAQPITRGQIALAGQAWSAFTADNPEPLQRLLDDETPALPFLRAALKRLAQEYPHVGTGLSRTHQQIITSCSEPISLGKLFGVTMNLEEAPYSGDLSFLREALTLARAATPLVEFADGMPISDDPKTTFPREIQATVAGLTACEGSELRPLLPRWIGGTQVEANSPWRWDPRRQRITW